MATVLALLICVLVGLQESLGQEFRDSPANVVALTNHPITLSCSAPDPSPPPNIAWYHNGSPVTSTADGRISISYDSATGRSEYAISNVNYYDAGAYQCVAVSSGGGALFQSSVGNLTVQGYPAFVRSLPPVTSYVGGEAVFQCEVLSNPPATVQWSFHVSNASSQPLTGNTRISINGATLTISDIQPSDEGFYECTALNIYGPNSTSGRLFIEAPPVPLSLTLTPNQSPYVLRAGEELVLRCNTVSGSEVTSLEWLKQSEPVTAGVSQDSSGIVLTIPSVQPADNGTYTCIATSADSSTESVSITVDVYTLPTVMVTPSLIMAVANSTLSASLTPVCQATGYPQPEISWLRPNGDPQPSIGDVPQFGVLKREDNGAFVCVASNAAGEARAEVNFIVEDVPLIQGPPLNTEASYGQMVTFSCQAVGPPSPSISWRRLDAALQNDSVQVGNELHLFSVTTDDNGRYECNATNSYGWRVAAANLTVLDRPRILSVSSLVQIKIGQSFTLNCSAVGPPSTLISWYHNGSLLTAGGDPRSSISPSNSLTITDALASHSGVYTCNASTSYAFDISHVDVTVGTPPIILIPPSSSDLPPGGSVFLDCAVGGLPRPFTTWYHTDELGDRQTLPVVAEGITTHTQGIELSGLVREDTGLYECEAENVLGSASASTRVRVEGFPLAVDITPTTLIAGDTYVLTCAVLYNYPLATVTWEREDGSPLPVNRFFNERGELYISPVAVEDEGVIRCTAANQYGQSSTTAFITVHARPGVLLSPSSPVVAILDLEEVVLYCTASGRPAPTVVWTLPPSANGPSSIPPSDLAPIPGRYQFDEVTGTLTIIGVEGSDSGNYTCTATNLVGTTSSQLELEVKGAAPLNALVSVLSSTVLILNWDPPPPALTSDLISYLVEFGPSESSERQVINTGGTINRQFVAIQLEEGTRYDFTVRGVYAGAIMGEGITVSGTTMETAPSGPPRNLSLVPLVEAIRITWLPPLPEDQNGQIILYNIHYREFPADTEGSPEFTSVTVTPDNLTAVDNATADQETTYVFDLLQLVGGRSYDVKIQAATAAGVGPNSTTLSATPLTPFPLTLVLAITIPVGSLLLILLLGLATFVGVWCYWRRSHMGKHSPLTEDGEFEEQKEKKRISGPIPGITPSFDTSASGKFTVQGKDGRVLHLHPKIITAADVAPPPAAGQTVQKVPRGHITSSKGSAIEVPHREEGEEEEEEEEEEEYEINPYASVQRGAHMGGWKAADIWDQTIEEEEEEEEEERKEEEEREEEQREALEEGEEEEEPGNELFASKNSLNLSSDDVSVSVPPPYQFTADPAPEVARDDANLVYSTVPESHVKRKRLRMLKEQQKSEIKARRDRQRMMDKIRKEQKKKEERDRKAVEKERKKQMKEGSQRQKQGLGNVVRLHEVDLSSRQGRAQAQFIDAATAAIF